MIGVRAPPQGPVARVGDLFAEVLVLRMHRPSRRDSNLSANLHPRMIPDGTITWTSPNGQTYVTRPGSRLLFPALCLPANYPLSQTHTDHPAIAA